MKSILSENYSYYPTVNKTKIMKLLKEEKTIIPPKNIDDIFENIDDESDDSPENGPRPDCERVCPRTVCRSNQRSRY